MFTHVTFDPISISLDKMLERYKTPRRRRKMERIYREAIAHVAQLAEPSAIYQEFDKATVPNLMQWVPNTTVSFVLAVCSLGIPVDDKRNELIMAEDIATAAVLDEITLVWLVQITNALHKRIRAEVAERGLKGGPAYRPGVGKWPIETQKTIFELLPAGAINVQLTPYLHMLPFKSTSLIIPILDKNKP